MKNKICWKFSLFFLWINWLLFMVNWTALWS